MPLLLRLPPLQRLLLGALCAAALAAQANPQFEVASVKVARDQAHLEVRPRRSTGRFRWTTQLWYLIAYAYRLDLSRISGNTAGLGSIYQIEATTGPEATEDQVRLMLQSLLAERFQIVAHRVTKDAKGYSLIVAKGGPKIQRAKPGEAPPWPRWMPGSSNPAGMEGFVSATLPAAGVGTIVGRRATMRQLARKLEQLLRLPVFDATGLPDRYYFAVRYAVEDNIDVPYPSLFGAMKELGLKLEEHKGPVDVLVIDHIQRTPAGN